MAKFLVTYHGPGMPADPNLAAEAKEAFGKWLQSAGKAVVDPGAPLHLAAKVATAAPAADAAIGGYTVVEASSVDEAVKLLKSHPFVARGGTLQVHQLIAV